MDSASNNPVASLSSNPWVAEQQSVCPRVALIVKSIIILLIIFLGFIKSKPCQLAWDLNSDRYDRSQNTDINNCQTRYHSTTFPKKSKEQSQNASGPNVADWQYLGVYKFTWWLEWNHERPDTFSSNREDTFAYVSYSSKDYVATRSGKIGRTVAHWCDDDMSGSHIAMLISIVVVSMTKQSLRIGSWNWLLQVALICIFKCCNSYCESIWLYIQ